MPFFSVVIPAYNRANTIGRAISSVLEQSYQDFEVVVVDDGSTDSTKNVIQIVPSNQVKYFYQSNKGVSSARNLGVSNASGEYICFLDSDDIVMPDWLLYFKQEIDSNLSTDVVFCNCKVKRINGSEEVLNALYPYKSYQKDESGIYLAGIFTIRRNLFSQIGGFDEGLKFGEFTDLGFRIKKYQPKVSFVNYIGMVYFIAQEGGGKNLNNKITSILHILQKHPEYFNENRRAHQLYLQNVGISYLKLGDYALGRKYLLSAWKIRKIQLKILVKILVAISPFLSKQFWK